MISGFVSPWEPLYMDLNIPKYFKDKKKMGTFSKDIIYINLKNENPNANFWKDGHEQMMKNH